MYQTTLVAHLVEAIFAKEPLRTVKGMLSAYVAYPVAEYLERRCIRPKLRELRKYYQSPLEIRKQIMAARLADTVEFAKCNVPYYRDLFASKNIDPEKIRKDAGYLNDIPFLDKEIIREQGERLLSKPLDQVVHHACKTGGSTGVSCVIYYDQEAADYSAAVTLYARERVGNKKYKPELHFACRFPDVTPEKWPSREDFKCFAMNRSNIFFDRIDDEGLEEIWRTLKRRRPYMVHAHPSTIYALACYVERRYGSGKAFDVFESSGELLESRMREAITRVLNCRVVDRYGLAELGVMAYQLDEGANMQVLDSEGWPESMPVDEDFDELLFTGFRNRLMPLIRYRTGDLARVVESDRGFYLENVTGRIHDLVPINGVEHATHYIQDVLDHRVGGIQEFQIDLRNEPPLLRIVIEPWAEAGEILRKLQEYWGTAFEYQFVGHEQLVRVGHRAKFRHVVTA